MHKPDNTPTVLLETIYLCHSIITETPMVSIIIETQDTAKSVAKNILHSLASNYKWQYRQYLKLSRDIKRYQELKNSNKMPHNGKEKW